MMQRLLTTLCLLFVVSGIVLAQPAVDDWETLLGEANGYYRQAMETAAGDEWKARKLYEKAAVYYDKIIADSGIRNGKLYYNLGNACFKMGDLGRAILNYLKAQMYMPGDRNLVQNLDYARSKRIDKVETKAQSMWIWGFLLFWIPVSVRIVLFTLFFLLLWTMAILKLFFKQDLLGFFLIIAICLAGYMAASLGVEYFGAAGERPGVVLASEVIARKAESTTAEPAFTEPLHAGTEFVLKELRRGWYNIELGDGRNCWIQEKDAGLVK